MNKNGSAGGGNMDAASYKMAIRAGIVSANKKRKLRNEEPAAVLKNKKKEISS